MISGDKVYLRAPEKEDLQFLYDLANSEENRQFLSFTRPLSKMDEEKWIEGTAQRAKEGTDQIFIICDKKTKAPVGNCGLHQINTTARKGVLGITILPKFQDKGYGPDALKTILKYSFLTLNMHLVIIEAIESNARAVHVYKDKLGFKYEATLRDRQYKDGKYLGDVVLSMTRQEWEKKYGKGSK